MPEPANTSLSAIRKLPKGIWALGFVSMFMDISSEMIHSLLPVYLTAVLGASIMTVGVIEGIAEATAAITKVFSGALSDYFRHRKLLVVIGYSLGALTKPIFPLANSIGWIVAARFIDRVGKGIRGTPRDALIADIVPARLRGTGYGLRQSLDSLGALIGPLLAILLMLWLADLKTVLWIAVIPAAIAVWLTIFAVKEPRLSSAKTSTATPLALTDFRTLPLRYWLVVALGFIFTLARFSEAFLILRAQDVGLAITLVPAIMITMNMTYALFAYPAGILSDHFSARKLLVFGLLLLLFSDVVLALADSVTGVFLGAALWGLHMALTQGLLAKLVADTAPDRLRGTAFGIFHLTSGIALLLASVIAGWLWTHYGPAATFMAGAALAAIALTGLTGFRGHATAKIKSPPRT